uniref:Dihydrolipoamide acetyltransferase component of pyruvate dehydrogenase complex n=1 Tax=Ascaris lumbricoides TaxID=6252 RepID=A0A0M3I167_ASCLU
MLKFLPTNLSPSARFWNIARIAVNYPTTSSSTVIIPNRPASMSTFSWHIARTTNKLFENRRSLHFSSRFYSSDLPQHSAIALPALSPTMQKGTIVSWKKKEGDKLAEGDLLCEIETDKAIMGYETPEEGYLAKIVLPEGTKDVPIGKLLCIIVPEKGDVGAFANFVASEGDQAQAAPTPSNEPLQASRQPKAPIPTPDSAASAHQAAPPKPQQGRVAATPYARKLAAEKGIALAAIAGSGPGGRILATDVSKAPKDAHAAASGHMTARAGKVPVAGAGAVDVPLSESKKAMAQEASDSKISIPHYYLSSLIYLDEILRMKDRINKFISKGTKEGNEISLQDFIVKASAIACTRIPAANSFFMDTFIRQNNNVDISIVLKTADGNVVHPVLFDAHLKGLAAINGEINAMKARAKEGAFSPQETEGGTFAISYMGEYASVHNFSAIIIPPQSCHLAVGHPEKKLIPDGNNEYRVSTTINVTLSCDHRVVDGAVGAQWLKHFKDLLEKPHSMLLCFIHTHTAASFSINSQRTANKLLGTHYPFQLDVRLYSPDLPKHFAIALPALSPTMQKGNIVSWKKKEGDKLSEGDLLCEIETDKAVIGYEAPEEGYLAKILLTEGMKDIPVGKLLCIIVPNEGDVTAFKNYEASGGGIASATSSSQHSESAAPSLQPSGPIYQAPTSSPAPPALKPQIASPPVAASPKGRIVATPYAKKLAAERGINLAVVAGTGPGGRIQAKDLTGTAEGARAPTVMMRGPTQPGVDFVDIPLSEAKKATTQRIVDSAISIPHYHLQAQINLDKVLSVKDKINELLSKAHKGEAPRISLKDYILKACAIACTRTPATNSFFMGTFIRQNNNVDISIAFKTSSGDLIYPVLLDAHTKGGTFTVSDVSDCEGVYNFSPIILSPQACNLAVGHIQETLVPDGDGGYKQSATMNVTLSCDRRLVDGAEGGQWLKHFKDMLEKPHTMLL